MNDRFFQRYSAPFLEGAFLKATLGFPAEKDAPLRKVMLRPVMIRGSLCCSFVYRYATRDETKNYPFPEALDILRKLLGTELLSLHFFMETEEVHLQLGEKAKFRVRRLQPGAPNAPEAAKPQEGQLAFVHDRQKERKIPLDAPFLEALGVVDASGKVKERMGDKLRQIERFVDLLQSAISETPLGEQRDITFWDMGAGKGYLTFATEAYLRRQGASPVGIGIESRQDLVDLCNKIARESGAKNLSFQQGNIHDFKGKHVDLLLALHACDTATDDAIAAGIKAGATVLLLAPCCHKELRPQVDAAAPHSPLHEVLKYGTFAERHAEMATDTLRALYLEKAGYKVRVAEFIGVEHTAKNVMLIASKRPHPVAWSGDAHINSLKELYGIRTHRLEELLKPLLERH